MRPSDLRGVRVALWWLGVYTRTLPAELREDRRDELRSDLHEHTAAMAGAGYSRWRASRHVVARLLRGAPADLWWRVEVEWERDRLATLLAHPSTLVTFLFALLLPVNIVWDALWGMSGPVEPIVTGLRFVVWTLACAIVVYVVAVVAFWATTGGSSERADRWAEVTRTQRVLRVTVPTMFFLYALAGLWRESPDPLAQVSAVAWGLFGVTLLVNLFCFGISAVSRRNRLHLGKVPS